MNLQKISAITLRVASMSISMRFYRDELGMEVVYGKEDGYFSSLRTKDAKDPILNLKHGTRATQRGRLIFHVSDVDGFWAYFKEKGLHPESPRDALMGRTVFPYVRFRWS